MPQDPNALKNEIISKLDLLKYYEERINARRDSSLPPVNIVEDRDGWSKKVLCPIHGDINTPNLSVNITNHGGFNCFACGRRGSLFDFHSWFNGLDPSSGDSFKRSVQELAQLAGIDIREWNRTAHDPNLPTGELKTKVASREIIVVNEAEATDKSQPPINKGVVDQYIRGLGPKQFKFLNTRRGLTQDTIEKYGIGFDPSCKVETEDGQVLQLGRYTIPVYGDKSPDVANFPCRNVRKYSPDSISKTKVINTTDYGKPARVFPLNFLRQKNWLHVFICEGEWDAILLNQKLEEAGYGDTWGAVTGTHGCNVFKPWWLEYLTGRAIYFLYDCDDKGKAAVGSHLTKYFLPAIQAKLFRSVRNIVLPLEGTKDMKDVTDFFVKASGTIDQLMVYVRMAKDVIVGGVSSDDATVEAEEVDSFISCIKDRRYIDRRVRVPITIAGQTSRIYHAPRTFCISRCGAGEECCNEIGSEHSLPYGHDIFIQACMASKRGLAEALKSIACDTPKACPFIEVKEKVVMQEYLAHQVVKRWRARENQDGKLESVQELVNAPVYILQPEESIDIKPQNYMAVGWVRSHPNSQQATMFIENLEPLEDDWKKFNAADPESIMHLKKIQAMTVKQITKAITDGVTHVYEADDLLLATLLCYLAPKRFSFNQEIIRGWMNIAIVGDSGTGKSKTYEDISDWLDLGSLFPVLSGSRTGLLYAIKQTSGEWNIKIGRYVMETGKIIAIDEAQEADEGDIEKMAIAMDKGWLEINQVASAGYTTETRALFLMNPVRGQTISSFTHGALSLTHFKPMFIRRLDLVIFLTGKSDVRFYNKTSKEAPKQVECEISADTFRTLVHWAWTRSINDIIWSEESTDMVMEETIRLATKYGSTDDIPLVWPQDFRKKLARMSTAIAILAGSFTDDYSGVVVLPAHVKAIARFVDTCYSSVACNLLQYANLSRKKKTLDDYEKIKTNFESTINNSRNSRNGDYAASNYFCQLLLIVQQTTTNIRKRDLQEQLGISMRWVGAHLNILQGYNLLEPFQGGYRPTRKFNIFMQKWTQENHEVEEMLNNVYAKIGERALMFDSSEEFMRQPGEEEEAGGPF